MQDGSLHFIYCLVEPGRSEVRYVGQTTATLRARLGQHVRAARRNRRTYVARWIRGLLKRGLKPEIVLIQVVDSRGWATQEQFWISYFRNEGHRLANLTEGGEGTYGWIPPPEWRAHNSQIQRKLWQNPNYRERWIAQRKLPPGRWARDYDCCVDCGRTDRIHAGEGKCIACYNRERHRRLKQPDRPYYEWALDHPCCAECGTTERPHKGFGLCTNCYARYKRREKAAMQPSHSTEA